MAGAAGLGFHPHFAGFWHRFAGKTLGATMWFWMMYRAKQDGPVLLVKCHGTHFCKSHTYLCYYRACNTLGTTTVTITTRSIKHIRHYCTRQNEIQQLSSVTRTFINNKQHTLLDKANSFSTDEWHEIERNVLEAR